MYYYTPRGKGDRGGAAGVDPARPKEMGVNLAVAVALDALVVRLVLLPVILRLGGHAAWRRPKVLDRVLPRVKFSH